MSHIEYVVLHHIYIGNVISIISHQEQHQKKFNCKYSSLLGMNSLFGMLQSQTNNDNEKTSFKTVYLPFIKTNTLVEISAKPATVALHVYFPALSKVS